MPWRDLAALLERMHELDAQDSRDSENLAMLVDRNDFWMTSEYASWITDPDDPEVKAARALRKRSGVKPPGTPPLRPVALRPPELHAQRAEQYEALANPPTPDVPTAKMSARDFAALMGR